MSNKVFSIFILILVSSGIYLTTLKNDFVYDDKPLILENKWITDIKYLPDIFFSSSWSFYEDTEVNTYRPMQHVVLMLEYHIFGLKPWGYHLVNILLHAANTILVFCLASFIFKSYKRLTVKETFYSLNIAFLAALFFATHPINTEAVAWVSTVVELSMTLMYLLSFYFYATRLPGVTIKYALSVFLFLLAVFLKEPALTLLFVIIVYDYSKDGALSVLRGYKRYLPYILAGTGYMALRFYALGGVTAKKDIEMGIGEIILNIFPLFFQYIKKLILPFDLKLIYEFSPVHSLTELAVMGSIVFTLIYLLCIFITKEREKVVFFTLSFIVIPLLPVFFMPILRPSAFVFGERYLYMPSIGFVLLFSYILGKIFLSIEKKGFNPKRVHIGFIIVSFLILMVYGFLTMKRLPAWKNNITLWTDLIKKTPNSSVAHNNLGNAFEEIGLINEAIAETNEAVRINPDYATAHFGLGILYAKKGMIDKAINEYRETLRVKPDFAQARNNLGLIYRDRGLLDESITEYKEALKIKPNSSDLHNNIGVVYLEKGLLGEAISEFEKALEINPDHIDVTYNLGNAYVYKGLFQKAKDEYARVLKINPNDPEAHFSLGFVYSKMGMIDQAKVQYKEAIRIDPNFLEAKKNLEEMETK